MSDQPQGGGPVFPVYTLHAGEGGKPEYAPVGGLTVLDYFAGQALAGLLANPDFVHDRVNAADTAFDFGEAMLAESNRRLQ